MVSALVAPTNNATAADDPDMMRQEQLEHIRPVDDTALKATRAYLQQRFARRSLPRRDGQHHIVYGGVSNRRRSTSKHRPVASGQADERQMARMGRIIRDLKVVEPDGNRSSDPWLLPAIRDDDGNTQTLQQTHQTCPQGSWDAASHDECSTTPMQALDFLVRQELSHRRGGSIYLETTNRRH
ncbi:hypothetical protein ACCO45_012779 [Purpureocillium lilacinum]|uniref:Uncharacterized protein n=1 Tax=Purpureocillium lilacinum TaxID=33203 RepID=A0ACC4D9C3_PURLI